jgi:hypothetical protein
VKEQVSAASPRGAAPRQATWLARKHAWKADFNQCGGRQLVRALAAAEAEYGSAKTDLPFVLIGHSKLFTSFNARSLRPFLSFVAKGKGRFQFAKFGDFDLRRLSSVQSLTS